MKKILKGLGIVLGLFIIIGIAIPFFFKDKVIGIIKDTANKELNAKLDFKDVSLSVFRDFPNLSIRLKDISVVGIDRFDKVPLFSAENVDVGVNIMDVIGGKNNLPIKSFHLEKPNITAIVLEDSTANYVITKPSAPSEPSKMVIELKSFTITDGKILYDNRLSNMKADIRGLNHKSKGDLGSNITELTTKTTIDSLSVRSGGMQYLKNNRLDAKVDVKADLINNKFTLKENEIALNDLMLKADGWVQMNVKDMEMDLKFSSPTSKFKDLFSIIPGAYTKNYKDVAVDGTFNFNGFSKGKYDGIKRIYPTFELNTEIQNGNVKYPSLPMGISSIAMKSAIKLPGGNNLDLLTIDVPKLNFNIGKNPMNIVFKLKTPISNPDIDAKAKGTLNLSELSMAFPMESVQTIVGIINADINLKAKMSQIEQKQYEQVNCNGTLSIAGMRYQAKGKPMMVINNMSMSFTPSVVNIPNIDAVFGKSDIKGSGKLDNILAYFSPKKTMIGSFNVRSNLIDMNEWIEPTPAKPVVQQDAPVASTARPFDRFDFTLDGAVNKMVYDKYELKNVVAKGNMTSNRLDVKDFSMNIGNSDMGGSGYLSNLFGYVFDNEVLLGDLNFRSNYMDVNQFMTPATATPAKTEVPAGSYPVPKNIAVKLHSNINKLIYTNMTLSNLTGDLAIQNQEVRIENMKTNSLGGNIQMQGLYSTVNPEKPKFSLKYDLQNIVYKEAFNYLNTVKSLAPIAQYIDGKFNTSMIMEGNMGNGMVPDFNSLSASGFLQTLAGTLKGFKPLESVSSLVGVKELNGLDLKDTKNWFDIVNGVVEIKEFDKQLNDIGLKIGGKHSLTNDMDYNIKAKIPRKLFDKNGLGAVNTGLNALGSEASKLGVNLNVGEYVNVLFNIGGTMTSPKVKMKLLGTEGKGTTEVVKDEIKNQANKAIDSLKTVANKELDKAKQKAEEMKQKAIDSASVVAKQKADELLNKAKQEVKDKVGDKAGEILDKTVGDKAKGEVDKVKDKLDKWNPFKKDKKGGR